MTIYLLHRCVAPRLSVPSCGMGVCSVDGNIGRERTPSAWAGRPSRSEIYLEICLTLTGNVLERIASNLLYGTLQRTSVFSGVVRALPPPLAALPTLLQSLAHSPVREVSKVP